MQRLLCIVGGMNAGGAETFLMKIYRSIDKTKYQFDFAVASKGKCFYDEEILSYGGNIYHITPKSKSFFKNFRDIRKLVKRNNYNSVLRISQHSLSSLELLAAWQGGAKIRVFRSSNSNTTTGSKTSRFFHKMFLFGPLLFSNVRIAPSIEAAKYMFGKNCIKKSRAIVVKNGIDLSVFCYSQIDRTNIRKELNLENSFVVGHIGRFNQQKNHLFLIRVFAEIKKIKKNAKLLLVGKGEKENEILAAINDYGLTDSVVFAGVRADVPAILSAMDVFVFPSLYEGLPNVVIEAQACGLHCVVSDSITKEAKITEFVDYLSLSESPEKWAKKAVQNNSLRLSPISEIKNSGYDIDSSASLFLKLVFKE